MYYVNVKFHLIGILHKVSMIKMVFSSNQQKTNSCQHLRTERLDAEGEHAPVIQSKDKRHRCIIQKRKSSVSVEMLRPNVVQMAHAELTGTTYR